MATQEQDIQFQIECLTHQLVMILMEDKGLTMTQALDMVYSSRTFAKVENPETGLYYQGAVYVMDMLDAELTAQRASQ